MSRLDVEFEANGVRRSPGAGFYPPPPSSYSHSQSVASHPPEPHADMLTGEAGSHPLGVAAGAAGAAAAGAAIGLVAGPVGAAVGAIVGAVAGGLAGNAVAESIDPSDEEDESAAEVVERPNAMPALPDESTAVL